MSGYVSSLQYANCMEQSPSGRANSLIAIRDISHLFVTTFRRIRLIININQPH